MQQTIVSAPFVIELIGMLAIKIQEREQREVTGGVVRFWKFGEWCEGIR